MRLAIGPSCTVTSRECKALRDENCLECKTGGRRVHTALPRSDALSAARRLFSMDDGREWRSGSRTSWCGRRAGTHNAPAYPGWLWLPQQHDHASERLTASLPVTLRSLRALTRRKIRSSRRGEYPLAITQMTPSARTASPSPGPAAQVALAATPVASKHHASKGAVSSTPGEMARPTRGQPRRRRARRLCFWCDSAVSSFAVTALACVGTHPCSYAEHGG